MTLDLRFYWSLLLRRLPVMALFVILCSGIAAITAINLPETYSSSARLLVEAPQIPDRMVNSTVQTDMSEQLDVIEQRLMTRANLIDLANRFDVFENMRTMNPDDVVEQMLIQTTIRRSAGRGQASSMVISFRARSGKIAADVVNEYVTLMLEANSQFRVSRAENTLEFFQQEADRLSRELDEQSAQIAAFKSANSEALPEDQSYRLGRQSLLQERISRIERDVKAAQAQRDEIQRIYETTGALNVADAGNRGRTPQEEQLIVAKAELEHALSIYSETSPRVVRIQALVDRLEAVVAAQTASSVPSQPDLTPQQALFNATIAEIESRIQSLNDELEETEESLAELQANIAASSANGIQLAALEREQESIQERYNGVVNNLNQARMSERIETTAQGQRISVIENATVPNSPTGPNRVKIGALGTMTGMGLAGAYFVLLELLNRTIRRPAELEARFSITPITTIPFMESPRTRLLRRGAIILVTLAIVTGVPVALWYIDTNYLPIDLVVQKVLNRLGLG